MLHAGVGRRRVAFAAQLSSVPQFSLSATPLLASHQASLSVKIPEPAQAHVRQVADAIQPSHPLLSPSPPAFNLYQHQGLF